MTRTAKLIVEKHADGYVAYPLGLCEGVAILGEGDTFEEALAGVTSAIRFTLETRSESEVFDDEPPLLDAVVTEAGVPLVSKLPGRLPPSLQRLSQL